MAKICFYLDGEYLKTDATLLDIFTPGRVKYHGAFETMHVTGKTIAYLNEHLTRLQKGLKVLRIKTKISTAQLKAIANAVVKKNSLKAQGRLRLMVFKESNQVHCACMIMPYKPYSARIYKEGLKCLIVKTNRKAFSKFANVKSLDYELFTNALDAAKQRGHDEAVLLNEKGHVFETSRGNIFIKYQGQWLTPPLSSGCLNGIMRRRVMDLSQILGIMVKEKNITRHMFKQSQGMFMSNSLLGLIRIKHHS